MDEKISSWLPRLITLEEYKGNWNAYINALYSCFEKDFVETRPFFQNIPIQVRYYPPHQEKGATFWHLVSEGPDESERMPDLRRCERIRWLRPIIENSNSDNIKTWETIRPWKNQKQLRINFALRDFSYMVVIAKREKGFDLITAFYLEQTYRREKLKKEYEAFLRQKKEGSTV